MTPMQVKTTESLIAAAIGLVACSVAWRIDTHRRRLARFTQWSPLLFLDVACIAVSIGSATALLVLSPHFAPHPASLLTPSTLAIMVCGLSLLFLWPEGRRQVQLQRPTGIVFGEWAILFGFYQIVAAFAFRSSFGSAFWLAALLPIAGGAVVLLWIVPPFVRGQEEHRILDRINVQGEFIQSEYVVPTPECPYPDRWQMIDAQSAEVEVLDFLKSLVITLKPDVILETGTFIGHSAIKMAEGLKTNGFGKIITVEHDPLVFARAKQNIAASGVASWIECHNASSLEVNIDEPIDILFSDSGIDIRESEIRRFLPKIKPRGLVLVHDASSSVKVVREAVLRLEREGLLSVVVLSTARGLVIAQKREGRT